MIASERFSIIVNMVNEKGFVNTKDLAQQLKVTETTIRRDCEELEKQGLLIRVHGGAKSIKQNFILSNKDEKMMSERGDIHSFEKDIVCQKAAFFVKDGDCIFIDGGTSLVPMVKYLRGKKVKIVTHSTLIANLFHDSEAELFVLGGKYIPEYNMSVGPITLNDLEKFNFDFAFLGCAGVDLQRELVYTAEMDTTAVKQKAMTLSVKNYLLIDSSKLYIKGFCSFIDTGDFDAIICNDDISIDKELLPHNFILVNQESV